MSLKQGNIATQNISHSLPSFAQAFSSSSLDRLSPVKNTLPPIQTRSPPSENSRSKSPTPTSNSRTTENVEMSRNTGRKRAHTEISKSTPNDDSADNSHDTPPISHIKEEPEQDKLDTNSSTSAATPTRPQKKRRVTVSGTPQLGLNTDVRIPPDQANSTPISPVVIGFTVQRDNPSAVELVRSSLSAKQKQKAIIEQRRGSIASAANSGPPTNSSIPYEERGPSAPKSTTPSRSARRSPNASTGSRRPAAQRPISPAPPVVQVAPPTASNPVPHHSLPPPPISFARRRAAQLGGGPKKKPADILISPREAHTQDSFAPSIQSAPPIPQGGGQAYPGRFQMSLPRLPSIIGTGDTGRRLLSGNVPPTPTRLANLRNPANSKEVQPIPGISGRSPPNASVAIASSLVPPTPSSLHHPGYSGDKSAFLAPFEMFYDALNDSKQLKGWLSEQLQKSNALMQSLQQQQEKMNEVVEGIVEKRTAGLKMEVAGLHRRVEELEGALRLAAGAGDRRQSTDYNMKAKGKQPVRNGIPDSSYTFPPVLPSDRDRLRSETERHPSPGWRQDRERNSHHEADNGRDSPFAARRLSLSASRLDPPRPSSEGPAPSKSAFSSPPIAFREAHQPPGKLTRVNSGLASHRSPRISNTQAGERDRDMASTPPPRRESGGSLAGSSPEEPKDDREP